MLPLLSPSTVQERFFEHFNLHSNAFISLVPLKSQKQRLFSMNRTSFDIDLKKQSDFERERLSLSTEPSRITLTSHNSIRRPYRLVTPISLTRRENIQKSDFPLRKNMSYQNKENQIDDSFHQYKRVQKQCYSKESIISVEDEDISPWTQRSEIYQSASNLFSSKKMPFQCNSEKQQNGQQLCSRKQSQSAHNGVHKNAELSIKRMKHSEIQRGNSNNLEFYNFIGKGSSLPQYEGKENSLIVKERRRQINFLTNEVKVEEIRIEQFPQIKYQSIDKDFACNLSTKDKRKRIQSSKIASREEIKQHLKY